MFIYYYTILFVYFDPRPLLGKNPNLFHLFLCILTASFSSRLAQLSVSLVQLSPSLLIFLCLICS